MFITTIFLYLFAVLPLIAHCTTVDEEIEESKYKTSLKYVAAMAENNKIIDKVLKPWKKSEGGYLGTGTFAFGWICDVDGMTLAIKFVPNSLKASVEREYRNYAGMYAINNTNVEDYGIPSLQFRGPIRFGGAIFDAIGLKYLKDDFPKLMYAERVKSYDWQGRRLDYLSNAFALNVFIGIQETMLSLSYAHDHGVQHNDLKMENHRSEGNRLFLIDWNTGDRKDDVEYCKDGSKLHASVRGLKKERRKETDDIVSTFLDWLEICGGNISSQNPIKGLKADIKFRTDEDQLKTVCLSLNHPKLQAFFREFREEAFYAPEHEYPRHLYIYELAEKYKKQIHKSDEPVYFSWLTDEEKAFARAHPPPKIVVSGPKEHYQFDDIPPFPDPRRTDGGGCRCGPNCVVI